MAAGEGALVPDAPRTRRGLPARTSDIPAPGAPGPPALPAGQSPQAIAALDVDLGPVPKEVVVGEATGLDDLQRIAHVPGARVGLALEGGNTLRPAEVDRLAHLGRVHLWLGVPLLPVHLEVIRQVKALCDVTVTLPAGVSPSVTLLGRLSAFGPGRVVLRLDGPVTPARLAPLAGRSHPVLSLALPATGLDRGLKRALKAFGGPVVLRVEAGADPRALAGLRGLRLAEVDLVTDANRVAPRLLSAAGRLGAPLRVILDGSVTAEDLRVLRKVPRLALRIRLAPATEVAPRLVRLLLASAGASGEGWSPGGGDTPSH